MDDDLTLIVDGTNIFVRGYYAHSRKNSDGEREHLTSSDGKVASGVFGVMQEIKFLARAFQPTHMIWMFDSGRSHKRSQLLDSYKGQRDKGEKLDELGSQFTAVDELFSVLNVIRYSQYGVEADDLIGCAVSKYPGRKVIVSADHDLRQFVADDVMVYKPSLGYSPAVLYDEKKIEEEYGLKPYELPFIWAVCGDSSDNIKGVPRYGYKTAKKAYDQYGGFNEMILRDPKLAPHADTIWRNYRLIKLDDSEGYLPHNHQDIAFDKSYNSVALLDFLEEWEFKSVLSQMSLGKEFWEC